MARRHHAPALTTAVLLGVGVTALLAGCSDGPAPAPSTSTSRSASASPSTGPTAGSGPAAGSSASPSDGETGSADDGTGPGTGNGSGVENPSSVDWASVTEQGIAAAGSGAVVSLTGSGDSWTVVVVGPDGSETQSVVSATLGRVTSGPFPKAVDSATGTADQARAAAATTSAATAAAAAERAVTGGTLSALSLGGTTAAPMWTATVTVSGAAKTVTVNALTGATTAS